MAARTPIFAQHRAAGARIVDFHGWELPVFYASVKDEHRAVRERCGIFDVSHMGEVRVRGPQAAACLHYLTIGDVMALEVGGALYTAMLTPQAGVVDDLIVYRLGDEDFLACVNAANTTSDFAWMRAHAAGFDAELADESASWAQIAIQGPDSPAVVSALGAEATDRVERLGFMQVAAVDLGGCPSWLARTGYTGERGYELYLPSERAEVVWECLAAHPGVTPVGLGARDTLRLEACLLLYGNDMDRNVTALEAGLGWAVRRDDRDFVGRAALEAERVAGRRRKLVAFRLAEPGVPRPGMAIFAGDRPVGSVTSGSVLPTVGGSGGLALVDAGVGLDTEVDVDIRGKRKLARVVKRPLYSSRVR